MDLAKIRELLQIVAESDVAEVEIEEDDWKIVVRKNTSTVMVQAPPLVAAGLPYVSPPYAPSPMYAPAPMPTPASYTPPSVHDASPVPPTPVPDPPVPTPTPPAADDPADEDGMLVRAPIVGTFYRASSPDAEPFVQVGDTVQPGDVLCIIEAMKLMNEIECEVSGTVRQILVQNAEPVEYDQSLFVIDPQ